MLSVKMCHLFYKRNTRHLHVEDIVTLCFMVVLTEWQVFQHRTSQSTKQIFTLSVFGECYLLNMQL